MLPPLSIEEDVMRAFIYTGGTVYDEYVSEKPQKEDLIITADAGLLTAERMVARLTSKSAASSVSGGSFRPTAQTCVRIRSVMWLATSSQSLIR